MSGPKQPVGDGRVPSAEDLFVTLTRAGVVLVADGERLRVWAPRGVLTTELRAVMELRRDALREIVTTRFRGAGECLAARGGRAFTWPCPRMGVCTRPIDSRPCLVPPTCCVCGAKLTQGRRYCCPNCVEDRRMRATIHEGDCQP